ncbi:peptide chain release factor N(5)-glutamine methyltransferase [uncultured Mucilaginibacter sp.]|uniref:peptide chain release factor N(5)-glutamine methyltransferase n=1 Tax=uncultured Mucilaginibacter sp. TaxID=797541 RepID=UPI0025FA01DF|nr:peptide chain release factor N(5)-glutamine methyltransferase [uncultured Mucilaginibacter sp.]
MKTVKDAFDVFKDQLTQLYDVTEIESIASLLIEELTGLNRAQLKAFPERELNVVQSERLLTQLESIKTGMPVQYVLGYAYFYGNQFKVNSSVLIPRPETEELVDWVIKTIGNQSHQKILDIGTGSGCIPISLKLINNDNELLAIDISRKALEVANANAKLHNASVSFIEADILDINPSFESPHKYNVIISNPPYVTATDKQQMHKNVLDFEPHSALFVPDSDPLLFYIAIANFAVIHLVENGYLFFEINESYGPDTVDMLATKGFIDIELRKDLAGKDRMIRAVWPG